MNSEEWDDLKNTKCDVLVKNLIYMSNLWTNEHDFGSDFPLQCGSHFIWWLNLVLAIKQIDDNMYKQGYIQIGNYSNRSMQEMQKNSKHLSVFL